jgi:hypothetical protein
MQTKHVKIILLSVVSISAIAVGGYFAYLRIPPPMPETADDVEWLLSSARYTRLSDVEKRPYQERMNEMWGGLSDADRKYLRESLEDNPDARQEAFEQGIRTFYRTMIYEQDKTARNAFLDMMIDQMESGEGRRQEQQRRADLDTPEGQERRAEGMRRMYDWLDKGDPQTMGYGSDLFKLMQERREERGLPPL